MNVLILTLSARREPWNNLMDAQIETWDSEHNDQTKTRYYVGQLGQQAVADPFRLPRGTAVWYSDNLTESLEDVSPRTIEAFERALALDWDYLARPHSSTYVHKANLVKFCETLPATNVLCGIETGGPDSFIWGGGHFLFSRDVITEMVANKGKWNKNVMDDQSLTLMAKELGVPVTPGVTATINMNPDNYLCLTYNAGENFEFTTFENIGERLNPHFFVRCKQDLRRHEDARIMRELHKHWR
jgi:hypothetical protein